MNDFASVGLAAAMDIGAESVTHTGIFHVGTRRRNGSASLVCLQLLELLEQREPQGFFGSLGYLHWVDRLEVIFRAAEVFSHEMFILLVAYPDDCAPLIRTKLLARVCVGAVHQACVCLLLDFVREQTLGERLRAMLAAIGRHVLAGDLADGVSRRLVEHFELSNAVQINGRTFGQGWSHTRISFVNRKSGRTPDKGRRRVDVGTQKMSRNASCFGDREYTLRWDPGPLPLADRLRGCLDDLRESILAAHSLRCEFDRIGRPDLDGVLAAFASLRRIEVLCHESKIHHWCSAINYASIAVSARPMEYQLMVDTIPKPAAFRSFGAWLEAMAQSGIHYREIAKVAGVSPQMVSKWKKPHKPAKPQPEQLEAIGRGFGVPYADLHRLVHRIKLDIQTAPDAELMATTTAGAEVARVWEQLDEPMRTEFMRLLHTSLDVQRAAKRKSEKS